MSKLIQTKRLLAMVMAVLLIVSLVPVSAFAETSYTLTGLQSNGLHAEGDTAHLINFTCTNFGNSGDLIFQPTEASNVQLIRKGVTYNIGAPGRDTLVIWGGGNNGYIRVSEFYSNLSGSNSGYKAPEQCDVFVVSGTFQTADGATTVSVETTYITVGADNALTFSTEAPVIDSTPHLTGLQSDGLHPNSATEHLLKFAGINFGNSGDLIFQPTEASNVQLIRYGKTYNIGAPGKDTLVIWGNGYGGYIKVSEEYSNLSGSNSGYKAPEQGDVFVVSGTFQTADGATTVSVETTYITVGADNALTFSTEKPATNLGALRDGKGITPGSNGEQYLYFNSDVTQNGWYCFAPESLDCIKFCRNGVTASVGSSNNGRNQWLRYRGGDGWCIELTSWYLNYARDEAAQAGSSVPDSISMPLQAGDVIIVSGNFVQTDNSDNVVHIDKTYFIVGESNSLTITTEEPDISCKHTTTTETTVEPSFTAPGYTVVTCDNCGEELSRTQIAQLSAGVQSWNVALSDNIRVNFALTLSVPDVSKAKVRVSVADSVSEYAVSSLPCENGVYSLSMDLAAAQMTDTLSVSFLYGDNTSAETTYSVRGYADRILTGAYSQATKALAREMLSYGGAAQTYFGYYTDRLASDGITGTAETEIPASCDPMSVSGSISGVNYYGASLVYRNRIAVRIYFTGDVSGCTFQIGEQTYAPVQKNGLSYIEVSGILPQNLDDAIALTVSSGDSTLSVTYSPLNYIVRMNAKDDASLKGLLKALYNYHLAAETYLTAPSTIVVEGGTLAEHDDGAELSDNVIFVSLADNLLPGNGDEGVTYTAADGVIKLVRDKETISLSGNIVKYEDGASYELYLEGDVLPMRHNDYLIVEGDFFNAENNYALRISKTYILNTNGTLSFATTEPVVVETKLNLTGMQVKETPYEKSGSEYLFHFKGANAGNADTLVLRPTSVNNIQLVRDGVTTGISGMGQDTIAIWGGGGTDGYIKVSQTGANLANSGIADVTPKQGDVIIVQGDFKTEDGKTQVTVEKTYIQIGENGEFVFSNTAPVEVETKLNLTGMQVKETPYQKNGSEYLFHFKGANAGNAGMLILRPTSVNNIQLVRDGVTTGISGMGQDTIAIWGGGTDGYIKVSQTGANLANSGIADVTPKQGDVIIVQGNFKTEDGKTQVTVEKTYIQVGENNSFTMGTASPHYINGGHMIASNQGWHGNGIHFELENDYSELPADDWKIEYAPTSTSCVTLIRDGVSYEACHVGRGTIVNCSPTDGDASHDLYLKIEPWVNPAISADAGIQDGDILVVNGDFVNQSNGYVLHIEKTYIKFDMVNRTVQFITYLENTEFGDIILPTSEDTINYGVWVGSYHVFTDDKLADLKAAGITKLIGIDPQWIGDENKDENGNISMNVLLDRCQKYGITVVAQVRSRTEDGTKYADSWDGITKPDYADHPALLGFELQDEPKATEFAGLADQKAVLKSLAPDKMVFVNLLPNCAGSNSLYGNIITNKNYEDDYVDAFMKQFEPDVLSWDFYATLSGGKIRTQYFSNFEIMAKKNVTKWYTMLSCGHDTGIVSHDTPTEDELRWQMAVALTYGVSDIDHYTYVSHDDSYDCMVVLNTTTGQIVDRTALYDDIEKVDNEYLSWGNIYKAYDYVGTGCVNVNSNQMLKELSNTVSYTEYGISSISTAEDLLVGIFEYEGTRAYMLTNAGKVTVNVLGAEKITMTDTAATLALENSQQYKCVAVISKGEITYMAIGADGTVEIPVGAYEGVFVIPVLN